MAVGMLKLGAVFDLVSPPVLTGFVSASAITIGVGQIKDLLGLTGVGREFISALRGLWNNIGDTNGYDLALGVATMIVLALLKKLNVRAVPCYSCSRRPLAPVLTLVTPAPWHGCHRRPSMARRTG